MASPVDLPEEKQWCSDSDAELIHCCLPPPPFPSNLVLWLQGQHLTPLLQNKSARLLGPGFYLAFSAFNSFDSAHSGFPCSVSLLLASCLSFSFLGFPCLSGQSDASQALPQVTFTAVSFHGLCEVTAGAMKGCWTAHSLHLNQHAERSGMTNFP